MGDTMREGFDVAMSDRRLPREDDPGFAWAVWRLAHEAGRQLGMEQARREPLTDAQIESQCRAGGARWSGDHWVIEDADLHPLIRSFIPTPPAGDSDTP